MSRKAKAALRRNYLELRRSLPPRSLADKNGKILGRLAGLLRGTRLHGLCLYRSITNEPDISRLAGRLPGCRTYFPRVNPKNGRLEFAEVRGTTAFRRSPLGILEPVGGTRLRAASSFRGPNKVVAVLVPGVVFDRHGGRIGFGKGYYDAFLGRAGRIAGFRTIRIGVAWDFQVRGAVLPADRHDVRMDMIVTEKRVIICGKAVRS